MKLSRMLVLFVGIILSGTCIVTSDASAQDKPITLRYATMFPVSHKHAVLSDQWCKEVEKRTNGKVQVRHFAGGTLTSPAGTYESIVKGVVDIGLCVLGYTMGKFPLSDVAAYPLGVPSGYAATKLANEYYAKFKPAEFDQVKVLYLQANGPGIMHTSKPVAKLEDMKGLKIRTFGPVTAFISNLGAAPVAMPMVDSYDAISRGVVDGIYAPYEALSGYKLGEVVKYSIENYGSSYSGVQMVGMNKAKWDGLPPDIQKIIEGVNAEWIEKQGKMWDEIDKQGKDFAVKRGNKIVTLSPEEEKRWAAKAQPMIDEYIKSMKTKGLPGEEVVAFYREGIKAYPK
ncbi:MAG: TRAP transporter substrate-binding protein [Pseudomonadota bacterium]